MQITNLLHHPHLIDAVAKMIYDEFWVDVVDASAWVPSGTSMIATISPS